MTISKSNFQDVQAFHDKFGLNLERPKTPWLLSPELFRFRLGFMLEELAEYAEAHGAHEYAMAINQLALGAKHARLSPVGNLAAAADALIDLSVVTLGTADFHGIPWQECWEEVHHANMSKVRAKADGSNSKRASGFDVVKPEGWKPPNIEKVLKVFGGMK